MVDVIVVGGGAAGMMAAISASQCDKSVLLLEKNEKLGKKLFITGKGRCNVTNAADMEVLFNNVITNSKFLYSSFYTFDNFSLMSMLEDAGCPLKIERGDRVFPVSDHSSDIIFALTEKLKRGNVDIRTNTEVKGLLIEEGICTGVELTSGKKINSGSVIVCTGGLSYPLTGSTGDGVKFARLCGHSIKECVPSLVPLECEEPWCKELMGLSLKNVDVTMVCENKVLYSGFGEMLFTHFGLSGPLILSASCFYSKRKSDDVKIYIDLKPALDIEQLDKRILRDFDENKNKQFKNSLNGLFPSKLIPVMISLSGINPDKKVNEISREERREFAGLIKKLPLNVTKTRSYSEAIITQGGVSVKEVNPSTMESKLVNKLYWAGEVLDLDAVTGGFNLQIAWSTGYLAGLNA